MDLRFFSYAGNDLQRCQGAYCTETVELPDRGKTHIFVLARANNDQTLILHNPRTTRSALHAVLADQSIPIDSDQALVTVLTGRGGSLSITEIAESDFLVGPSGDVSMADRKSFHPECIYEPLLAKSLADLLAPIIEYLDRFYPED